MKWSSVFAMYGEQRGVAVPDAVDQTADLARWAAPAGGEHGEGLERDAVRIAREREEMIPRPDAVDPKRVRPLERASSSFVVVCCGCNATPIVISAPSLAPCRFDNSR